MPVVADLHVHTTNSDGTLDVDDLPHVAREAGLTAVAVTDHDGLHPSIDAPVSTVEGLTLVHGIELRVEASSQHVDLLGYAVEPTPALTAELERLQRDRVERGAAMIERVESRLGVDLEVESRVGFGRPHLARAIAAHPDVPYGVQDAFDHMIGDGRPCFVPREVPDFERGRRLLAESCALVGLAHPLRYDDPDAALALTRDLDAVERWYPYDRPVDPAAGETPSDGAEAVERAISVNGLIATGGSDAHDRRLGRAGLDRDAYERVVERLPAPT